MKTTTSLLQYGTTNITQALLWLKQNNKTELVPKEQTDLFSCVFIFI